MQTRRVLFAVVFATACLSFAARFADADAIDLGVQIDISGTFSDTTAINTTIYDKDIHSGAPRDVHASPSALTGSPLFSDSYVLQGGDPYGGDTFDPFEVSQASGHASVGPDILHQLELTTSYAFGPIFPDVGPDGSPDTGFLTVTNNSLFPFTSPITISGLRGDGFGFESQTFSGVILPGASIVMTIDSESSNVGGFNPVVPEPLPFMRLCGLGAMGLVVGGMHYRRRKV